MFCYQCRYCKVNFEQWEKLVTHRRDEHKQEFQALKRRAALLLRRQEEATTKKRNLAQLENRCRTHVSPVKSLPLFITTNKMKPTATTTASSSASIAAPTFTTPPRKSHKSKELDAKDLENQEISLCIPATSSVGLRCSTTILGRDSPPPPYLFPTPASSPRQNGNSSNISRNGSNGHLYSSLTASSYLTPPVTPSRHLPSPLLSAEELVLNMNMGWSPPVSLMKAVQYHEMSDEDEIEISMIPASGSLIKVTKNYFPRAYSPPLTDEHLHYIMLQPCEEFRPLVSQQCNNNNSGHVIIENIEDELRMSCSSNGTNGQSACFNSAAVVEGGSSSGSRNLSMDKSEGTRQMSHLDMLRSTGQRLKRLHSKLEQQNQQRITRMNSTLPSSISTTPSTCNGNNNDNGRRIISNNNQGSSNNNDNARIRNPRGVGVDKTSSSSSATTAILNTSKSSPPRVVRLDTIRASPRRPKKLI